MIKSYFKIAWRNLLKDQQFTILNLLGLSIGLTCVFLICLWVIDEQRVDKFHEKDNRLFQVMERHANSNGITVHYQTSGLAAEELKEKMPEVEYATAVLHYSWFPKFQLSVIDNKKIKAVGQFADKDFFNIFSYELLQGDKSHVLSGKHSVVISEKLALSLFNTTQNIIGKAVNWELGGLKKQVMITGVFKNVPVHSSEQFDFLMTFNDFKEISPSVLELGNNGTNTYVVLKESQDVAQFNTKISNLIQTKLPGSNRTIFLSKFSNNYLYGTYENGVQAGGRIEYVRLFTVVAIIILIIACINFMNLSTAKATRRLKDVGVRKVVGASRSNLILQYISESVLMAFFSLSICLVLIWLLLPLFNSITGKNLAIEWNAGIVIVFLSITLLTGFLSGSYPALYLSGFKPVSVLKGKLRTSLSELWIRKGLVVFQFTLSVLFIISVLVIHKQVELIQNKKLGYDKENVIYFTKEGGIQEYADAFLSELKQVPGVIAASATDHLFVGGFNTTGGLEWQGKHPAQDIPLEIVHADYDMIEMLGIEMKEGRSFSRNFGTDSTRIIFNEAAINMMGLKDPVGKTIKLWGEDKDILGVTKNFHFESLHKNIKPLFILLKPEHTHYILVKIGKGLEKEVLSKVNNLYDQYNPGSSIDYRFLDEDYQALYASEQRVAVLSRSFAFLSIMISCLGLFGLAAFTAQKRRKEISIRKVVGASVSNIVVMLSKDFLQPVMFSVLIAFPIAWWIMNKWLNDFAYRISIGAGVFLIAGASIILITLVTVSFQAIRAAISNPVKNLRTE